MTNDIETGDIYFFYRPKVNAQKIKDRDDVQRLHLVLVPDNKATARLFIVGRKQLPEIIEGESKSTERDWMMTYRTGEPKDLAEDLAPLEYETKTRGQQEQGEAIPVGEGRYVLYERHNSSRLAYRLANPEKPGKAQKELGIRSEASYIISVRNPSVKVSGFPDAEPDYPKSLQDKFADKRWIDIDDPRLLNYENAQLLLVGAHSDLSEEDIDITGKPDLFKTLGLKKREWPTEALEEGKMAEPQMQAETKEPTGDRSKGGERGGKAASQAASSAGIAHALKGVDLPTDKSGLIKQAKGNQAGAEIIKVLEDFPSREYTTMADVQKAVGEVR